MLIQEIKNGENQEFFVDVTDYAQKILGEIVKSAQVFVGYRDEFDSLSEKKKKRIREKAQKMADNIEKHFESKNEIEIPGTGGYLKITFCNEKEMFLVSSGDDYNYFGGQKTWM